MLSRKVIISLGLILVAATILVPDREAAAASRYWVSAGAGNWNDTANWSTTTGGAGGASVPGSLDTAIFDAGGVGNCTVNATVNVRGFSMAAGYTGTISQGAFTITIGSLDYTQAGGNFSGSALPININGAFSLSGGAFTLTTGTMTLSTGGNFTQTGGTFTPNNGTVVFTGFGATIDVPGTITFYNLTINKSTLSTLTIAAGDTVVTTGLLALTTGRLGTGTLDAQGDVTVGTGWSPSGQTGTLEFIGNANQAFTVNAAEFANPITVNKTGGSVDAGSTSFEISNTFTLTNGTFASTTGTLTFSGGFAQSGGTFTMTTGTMELTGGGNVFTQTGGTFIPGTGTVTFTGNNATIDVATSITFYNLTIDLTPLRTLTIATGDTLVTTGLLALTTGRLGTGTLDAQGDVTVGTGWSPSGQTGTLEFIGNTNQAFTVNAAEFANPITVNKTGGSVDAGSTTFEISNTFILTNGTFTSTTGTLTLTGGYSQSGGTFTMTTGTLSFPSGGNVFTQTGGTFIPGTGTVIFTGNNATIDVATSITFYNLTINLTSARTLTIASGDTLVTTGLLALTDGRAATGTLEAQGDVTVGAGWDNNAGQTAPLQFTGNADQTFTVNVATFANPLITVNKTGGTVNAGTTSFTFPGTFNLVNGGFTSTTGTLTLTGSFTQAGGTFNGGTGTITVSGPFALNGGAFTSTTGLLTFSAIGTPFTFSGGTFDPATGTVRYTGNGATTITAASYYNLEIMPNGNTRTHTLSAGTFNIGGDFTAGDGVRSNIIVTAAVNATTLTVTGNLTISSSTTLVANGVNPLTVGGSWSNSGTFTHSNGTVILNGASPQILSGTMTGASSFSTLTITNNSGSHPVNDPSVAFSAAAEAVTANIMTASTKVRFNSGSTYTFTNINFGPAAGPRIQLWPSLPGSQWNLNVAGSQTVQNTDARDSNATGNTIDATDSSNLDSGNNINWNFGAQTCSTAQTGDWNAAATWNAPCNVAGGPTAAKAVYINSGHTVTVTANAAAANITTISNATATGNGVTVASGVTLNVSGLITLNDPGAAVSDLNVGGGNLSVGGLTIRGNTTPTRNATVTIDSGSITTPGSIYFLGTSSQARLIFTGTGTLTIGGSLAGGGTVTAAAGSTIHFNGAAAQSAGGYSYAILKANNTAGVTLSGAASVSTLTIGDVTANSLFSDGGFQLTSTGTLNITSGTFKLGSVAGATTFPVFTTLNLSPGTTVEYSSGVAQVVSEVPPYRNLVISGSGVKMLSASLTVQENLTVNDTGGASTLMLSGDNTLAVNGMLTVTGTGSTLLADPTDTFVKIVAGNVTVDAGGRIDATGTGCGPSSSFDFDTTDGTPTVQCRDLGSGVTVGFGEGGDSSSGGGGGAGYGGTGGLSGGTTSGGFPYGINLLPYEMGSGGGNGSVFGGAGGGSIRLQVSGTLTLNGMISADGNSGNSDAAGTGGGGGSGGGLLITAGTVTGAGGFQSNGGPGGNGATNGGGGGSAGRVAVFITAVNSFSGTTSCLGGPGGTGPSPGALGADNPNCLIQVVMPASNPDGVIDGNGDNVYGAFGTGAGGMSTQISTTGSAIYSIELKNKGGTTGSYGVNWKVPGPGWAVTLVDDLTNTVYTKNFITAPITAGGSRTFTLKATQTTPIPPDGTYNIIVNFIVLDGSSGGDSITAIVEKTNQRPDGIIDGNGFNLFGPVGSGSGGQSSRNVTAGVTTSYSISVLNNESSADTFTLSWNTPSGWTVLVNDGSSDQASGFSTASIPAGGSALFTLLVTPTATSTQNIIIDIVSNTTAFREDSLTAVAVQATVPAAPIACTGASAPSSGCLAPAAISPTEIKVYWKDNSTNETGFRIENAVQVGGACDGDEVYGVIFTLLRDTVGSPGTGQVLGYTDSGLAASTAYCYRFQSYNSGGDSSYSAAITTTTMGAGADTDPPGTVTDLAVEPESQRQDSISLNWTAPPGDASVPGVGQAAIYDLRYSTLPIVDGGAGPGQVDFTSATIVTGLSAPKAAGQSEQALVSGLSSNTIYYFALKSTDAAGNVSAMSNLAGGDNLTNGSYAGRTALRTNLNIISVPLVPNPSDPVSVFQDDIGEVPLIWTWSSSGLGMVEGVDGCYNAYPGPSTSPCVNITAIVPGQGYFIQGGGNRPVIDVPVGSTPVGTSTLCGLANSYAIPLQLGWNMIGDPFPDSVDFTTVFVRQNGSACADFATAVANGWVGNSLYDYNGSGYNFTLYSTAVLEPWNGYWLWVMNNNLINGNTYELVVPQPP